MSMAVTTNERTRAKVKVTLASVTISEAVFSWIERKFGEQRNASKKLSSFASHGEHQVSHRTTEKWLKRKAPPSLDSIEIMAARCEDLARKLDEERAKLRSAVNR
jgi:hypothetical protein